MFEDDLVFKFLEDFMNGGIERENFDVGFAKAMDEQWTRERKAGGPSAYFQQRIAEKQKMTDEEKERTKKNGTDWIGRDWVNKKGRRHTRRPREGVNKPDILQVINKKK